VVAVSLARKRKVMLKKVTAWESETASATYSRR